MAAIPLLEETSGGPSGTRSEAQAERPGVPGVVEVVAKERPLRKLSVYPAGAGFDLVDELAFLCSRTIEPNIFFNPHFLAPAMPRLEDREVRLAVIRDGDEFRNRLRLLVPYSVERRPVPLGVPVVRTWASPFGPLGTPLLDSDDPVGVVEDFLSMLSRPRIGLPEVLMMPEMYLDGPVVEIFKTVADARNLPLITTGTVQRPILQNDMDGDAYIRKALGSHHAGEYRRLLRRLSEKGDVRHVVARSTDEVRSAMEGFLELEASGWKGRQRSAMASDRYRAAFAREALNGLASHDLCRIHSLVLDGRPIASLVVFQEAGVAYTWKIAYDETFAAYSPGMLLMIELTRQHLADPDISHTDSCAVPDHPLVSRLWSERKAMGTILIGLKPEAVQSTRRAASQLRLYRETRNMVRLARERVGGIFRRR